MKTTASILASKVTKRGSRREILLYEPSCHVKQQEESLHKQASQYPLVHKEDSAK